HRPPNRSADGPRFCSAQTPPAALDRRSRAARRCSASFIFLSSRSPLCLGGEQTQRLGQAAEQVAPAILKAQTRAGDEVAHGARDEDFAGARNVLYPCGGVNRDAANILASDLDLAGMKTAAHLNAERAHFRDDGGGAAHGASWAIESREKAVSQGLDLAPAKPSQLLPYGFVVPFQ